MGYICKTLFIYRRDKNIRKQRGTPDGILKRYHRTSDSIAVIAIPKTKKEKIGNRRPLQKLAEQTGRRPGDLACRCGGVERRWSAVTLRQVSYAADRGRAT